MDTEKPLLEKLLYRLIKKHIAGSTINSAINKAKELNRKGINASITYLSNNIEGREQINYIVSTYKELSRRLRISNVNATLHIPINQIGYELDPSIIYDYIEDLEETHNKNGVFTWLEMREINRKLLKFINEDTHGMGIAIPIELINKLGNFEKPIKIICNEKIDTNALKKVLQYKQQQVLQHPPIGIINKINTKNIVFEFQYGYKTKKVSKLAKSKKVSVYLPFGKNWEKFAKNLIPEGYMRILANKILKEEENHG